MFSYTASSVPYWPISLSAVFSPMPGTPGMLSELSPISALMSTSPCGSVPYFSRKYASSQTTVSLFPARELASRTVVFLPISCRLSRSPVAM